MEDLMNTAGSLLASADMWLIALGGVLVALLGVAKLTKTKKDDKYIQMAINGLNKLKSFLPSLKKSK